MATRKLATFRDDPEHRYNVVLDGETFTVEWRYNSRAGRWTTNWYDIDNQPVRHGVRMVIADDLFKRVALSTKPAGSLNVVDTTGEDTEPDNTTLGDLSQVRYVDA